jgi:hypothetical protein
VLWTAGNAQAESVYANRQCALSLSSAIARTLPWYLRHCILLYFWPRPCPSTDAHHTAILWPILSFCLHRQSAYACSDSAPDPHLLRGVKLCIPRTDWLPPLFTWSYVVIDPSWLPWKPRALLRGILIGYLFSKLHWHVEIITAAEMVSVRENSSQQNSQKNSIYSDFSYNFLVLKHLSKYIWHVLRFWAW